MPIWTCPKCGQRVESFSWNEKPWNDHVCRDIRKEILPETEDNGKAGLQVREKRNNNLSDFF